MSTNQNEKNAANRDEYWIFSINSEQDGTDTLNSCCVCRERMIILHSFVRFDAYLYVTYIDLRLSVPV